MYSNLSSAGEDMVTSWVTDLKSTLLSTAIKERGPKSASSPHS